MLTMLDKTHKHIYACHRQGRGNFGMGAQNTKGLQVDGGFCVGVSCTPPTVLENGRMCDNSKELLELKWTGHKVSTCGWGIIVQLCWPQSCWVSHAKLHQCVVTSWWGEDRPRRRKEKARTDPDRPTDKAMTISGTWDDHVNMGLVFWVEYEERSCRCGNAEGHWLRVQSSACRLRSQSYCVRWNVLPGMCV